MDVAGTGVWLATIGWPVVVLGTMVVIAVMVTITSQDRTRRLAILIRAVRSRPALIRKK